MKIHFQTGSSEEAGFDFFTQGNSNSTDRVLGPAGLLSFFELHSGLTAKLNPEPYRMIAFRNRLHDIITEQHPFYKSFSSNEFSVCMDLLGLYDELILLEWKGDFNEQTPRLQLLSEAMNVLKEFPGESDRWAALSAHLNENPFPSGVVDEILVYDEEEWIHPFFRKFFRTPNLPGIRYVKVDVPRNDNNLGILRQKFINKDFSKFRFKPSSKDSSVLIIQGHDVSLLADLVNSLEHSKSILVDGGQAGFIDASATRLGMPLSGLYPGSVNNGFNMLPFHLINILKEAPDALAMISFLGNSLCPVKFALRFPLLKLLKSKPGFDPEYWKKELLEGNGEEEDRFRIDLKKYQATAEDISKEIDLWFASLKKARVRNNQYWYDRQQIRALFMTAAKALKEEEMEKGAGISLEQFVSVLDYYPAEEISEQQLYLFFSSFIRPVGSPVTLAETGFIPNVGSPSSVISRFDTVIWWNLSENSGILGSSLFYSVEKDFLRGKSLWSQEFEKSITGRWYAQSARPILNCSKRLILVTTKMMNGHEMDRHPFLDYLEGSAENLTDILLEPDRNHENFYQVLADVIPGLVTAEPVTRNLPEAKENWQISKGIASLSPTESFSSLEKLIYYPHEYVLERIASLKDYSPPDPSETLLHFGICSHRIFELIFKQPGVLKVKDGELEKMVDEFSSKVIREQFIALDAPEFSLQKQVFILKMHKAVKCLFYHLRKGNFTEAVSEENFKKERAVPLGNIRLTGKIDLHLTTAGGHKAIIDLKWTGASKRKKMLKKEKDLQLCLYSYLLNASPDVPTAFFIIDSAQLISYRSDFFPEASWIYNEQSSREILRDMVEKIMKAYDLRKAEIENGDIEVGLETEYDKLAVNSRVWQAAPLGADFPKAHSASDKIKPANKYSDYSVLSPEK